MLVAQGASGIACASRSWLIVAGMVFKRKIGLPSERATRKLTDDHGLVGIWRRYNPVISLFKE